MTEKIKNREWVKNVAIIFLAVLLVLTFFSNTILNRSLPEVATQMAAGGTINARIRVTGAVTANQNYQVMIDQSRKVKSVMVKQGQEVSAGDVLFVLSDAESAELESARETLRQLEKSYQTAVINAADGGSGEVERARQDLAEAEAERDRLYFDESIVPELEQAAKDAKAATEAAEDRVDAVNGELQDLGVFVTLTREALVTLKKDAEAKETAYLDAKNALTADRLIHGTYYNWILSRAEQVIRSSKEYKALSSTALKANYVEEMRPAYMEYVVSQIENGLLFPYDTTSTTDSTGTHLIAKPDEIAKYTTAYKAITDDEKALEEAEKEYTSQSGELPQVLKRAETALDALDAAKKTQTDAEETRDEYKQRKTDYRAAVEAVRTCQRSLEDKLKQAKLDSVELSDLSAQIAKQREKVEELSADAVDKEITAEVGGTIATIDITAGQTTTPNSPMATIEVPDMGYALTATVTNDQARRVHVGDSATVSNMYWGSQIDAVLTKIRTDPKDPQNSKQLTFDVTGDVSPGSNLTLSVGQRSAEYDFVVPNSALRRDTNGDFVLVVVAKSSALGDRYTATRVDVTKLASDDTATAVSGALENGDFVITTSTAPIKNGDRVRLSDTLSGK